MKAFVIDKLNSPILESVQVIYDENHKTTNPRFKIDTGVRNCLLNISDEIATSSLGIVGLVCKKVCQFANLSIENGGCKAVNREVL